MTLAAQRRCTLSQRHGNAMVLSSHCSRMMHTTGALGDSRGMMRCGAYRWVLSSSIDASHHEPPSWLTRVPSFRYIQLLLPSVSCMPLHLSLVARHVLPVAAIALDPRPGRWSQMGAVPVTAGYWHAVPAAFASGLLPGQPRLPPRAPQRWRAMALGRRALQSLRHSKCTSGGCRVLLPGKFFGEYGPGLGYLG